MFDHIFYAEINKNSKNLRKMKIQLNPPILEKYFFIARNLP